MVFFYHDYKKKFCQLDYYSIKVGFDFYIVVFRVQYFEKNVDSASTDKSKINNKDKFMNKPDSYPCFATDGNKIHFSNIHILNYLLLYILMYKR